MSEPSHKARLVRSAVLSVLRGLREPASTTLVTRLVTERAAAGLVRGVKYVEPNQVRAALASLVTSGQVQRLTSGDVEPTRGRFRGAYLRAVRGSVTWSVVGNGSASVW